MRQSLPMVQNIGSLGLGLILKKTQSQYAITLKFHMLMQEKQVTHALELLAGDINPSEHKKAATVSKIGNLADSFEVVAREWAISYFTNKSASHKDRTIRRLENNLFPWLGSKPIADITAAHYPPR